MFNNAGIGYPTPIFDHDLDDYHRIININQHGGTHRIIGTDKKMRALNIHGVIINIASVFSFLASIVTYAYHVSKVAVIK
ncbi:SDR family NAD(P)-dependent oxidoreductase [Bacillus toyonensis]|uniref:SDR family NAD(P)-dependent oxidoreductase n=1 Tax=Bacillus toyonensis TaxID=155322 RepID=UPI00211D37FE|nr:SDR family NAD(P)-dependent oxidoreductase [Bacillus toyonensis]